MYNPKNVGMLCKCKSKQNAMNKDNILNVETEIVSWKIYAHFKFDLEQVSKNLGQRQQKTRKVVWMKKV